VRASRHLRPGLPILLLIAPLVATLSSPAFAQTGTTPTSRAVADSPSGTRPPVSTSTSSTLPASSTTSPGQSGKAAPPGNRGPGAGGQQGQATPPGNNGSGSSTNPTPPGQAAKTNPGPSTTGTTTPINRSFVNLVPSVGTDAALPDEVSTPLPTGTEVAFTSKLLELMHLDESGGLVALASAPLMVLEIVARAIASAGSGLVAPASLLISGILATFFYRRRSDHRSPGPSAGALEI
jgi:hypothetical protein